MWTSEEKEERINSLLEFLNNEYKNQHKNQAEITVTELNDRFKRIEYILGFEMLNQSIEYQIKKRSGGSTDKNFEYREDSPGVTKYISKASKEELEALKKRVVYHIETIYTYGLLSNLND